MTQSVAVIDYGMGNLHSVASALEQVGATEVVVSHEPRAILDADRVVFPGVGIFLTVLSYNLVGEAIQEATDPRLREAKK